MFRTLLTKLVSLGVKVLIKRISNDQLKPRIDKPGRNRDKNHGINRQII